ncbi:MAG: hypothetical protein ACP5GJ_04430 [Nanopusillaceae archaeon]
MPRIGNKLAKAKGVISKISSGIKVFYNYFRKENLEFRSIEELENLEVKLEIALMKNQNFPKAALIILNKLEKVLKNKKRLLKGELKYTNYELKRIKQLKKSYQKLLKY